MPVKVKTIEAYRVEESNDERRVFIQVNKKKEWELLANCEIPPELTLLYYEFPSPDPTAKAWDNIPANQMHNYVPVTNSKLFQLAKEKPFFDAKLAEQKGRSRRHTNKKRAQPASAEKVAKPTHPLPTNPSKKQRSERSPASRKAQSQQKVGCLSCDYCCLHLCLEMLSTSCFYCS